MRIFSRRARNNGYDNYDNYDRYDRSADSDGTTTTSTTPPSTAIQRAYAYRPAPATTAGTAPTMSETTETTGPVDDGRRWHHGPTRAIVTLLAAAVAGLLAWTTTTISHNT